MYSFLFFLFMTVTLFMLIVNAIILAIVLYSTALTAKAHALLVFEDKSQDSYHKDVKRVIGSYILIACMYAVCPFILNWATFDLVFTNNYTGFESYMLLLALMSVVWLVSWLLNIKKLHKQVQYKHSLLYVHRPVPSVNRTLILKRRKERLTKHFVHPTQKGMKK